MILAHLRMRRRVALRAAGLLDDAEERAIAAHVESCARCRREDAELRAVVEALEADPRREAEPDLPLDVLVRRVELEVGEALVPHGRPRWWLVALPAAAAALAAVVLVPLVLEKLAPTDPAVVALPVPSLPVEETEGALDRLEHNLAREHAARYLSEARDVLVTVAASGVDCDREEGRLDVGEAPDRSRALLARRALLVEEEAVASARAVLDDVELALREVAELPACVRRRDVERLRDEVVRRHLLMRIRLTTRELEG